MRFETLSEYDDEIKKIDEYCILLRDILKNVLKIVELNGIMNRLNIFVMN